MESLLWYYAKGKPKEHVELGRDSADLMAKFAALDEGRARNARGRIMRTDVAPADGNQQPT